MSNELITSSICENSNPEPLEIFVKRIIAKWDPKGGEQIFFNVLEDAKVPVDICVHNYPNYEETLPVNCILSEKLMIKKTRQEIICTTKARLKIWFKILLVVQFDDDKFETLMLPDDIDSKACYVPAGLFESPIWFGKNESLAETTIPGTSERAYLWTLDVPFTDPNWVGELPREIFDNPTLQSEIIIKCSDIIYDVQGDCACGEIPGTLVHVSVISDIIDKVGIHEDICINGTLLDKCEL